MKIFRSVAAATLGWAFVTSPAYAIEFCTTTSYELSAALTQAATLDDDSIAEIRVVSGIYDGSFMYVSPRAFDATPAVSISGGWAPGCLVSFGAPSVLTGDLVFTGPQYSTYPLSVSRMVINGMLATRSDGTFTLRDSTIGGDLSAPCCVGGVFIERNAVFGSNVLIETSTVLGGSSTSVIRNNLFSGHLNEFAWRDLNHSGSITFRGNTVHFSSSSWPNFRLAILSGDSVSTDFRRNLITTIGYTSVTIDLDGNGNFVIGPKWIEDNWIDVPASQITLKPAGLLNDNGNVTAAFDLPYVSAEPPYDFRLVPGSLQIDYSPPSADDAKDYDIDGFPRVMNGMVDIGAYETFVDVIFQDGFEQAQQIQTKSAMRRQFWTARPTPKR